MVDALRGDGHNVLYATESPRGATDDELLTCAVSEERILLTEDKDFGELVYRLRRTASFCCALTSLIVPSRFTVYVTC